MGPSQVSNKPPPLCSSLAVLTEFLLPRVSTPNAAPNAQGILVDPPPHSGAVLRRCGIPAHLVDQARRQNKRSRETSLTKYLFLDGPTTQQPKKTNLIQTC